MHFASQLKERSKAQMKTDTFHTDGTDTGIAMRAEDKGRTYSLQQMIRGDRQDVRVMDARTAAADNRGATPIEIQRNVMAFDGETFPIPETRGFIHRNIHGFPAGHVSREAWRTMSGDERAAMWARIDREVQS
jgi:hypothetical protein